MSNNTPTEAHTLYAIRIDGALSYIGVTRQKLSRRLDGHKNHARNNPTRNHWFDVLAAALDAGKSVTIEPLAAAASKAEALRLEAMVTSLLVEGGASLHNRCVGGRYRAESRARISRATKRQPRVNGDKGVLAAVPVLDADSGTVYPSVSAAARAVGALQSSVTLAIRRGHRVHGHKFERLDAHRTAPIDWSAVKPADGYVLYARPELKAA